MKRIDPDDLDIPVRGNGEQIPDWAVELPKERQVCPICKGVGYLSRETSSGNFELVPCRCKRREIEESDYQELQRISNLEAFSDKTFETFDATVPGVAEAYEIAHGYLDQIAPGATNEKTPTWLLLTGNFGCGKSHLAAAIANEAVHRHIKTLFTIVPDLLDHLRASYAPTSRVRYDERIESVRTIYLLILDDLGTENASPWAAEKLYQIINYRYNYRLPTVITTNRPLNDIEPRIRSRIWDRQLARHVLVQAEDYRRKGGGGRRKG